MSRTNSTIAATLAAGLVVSAGATSANAALSTSDTATIKSHTASVETAGFVDPYTGIYHCTPVPGGPVLGAYGWFIAPPRCI